jgi:hypothetical protein
MKIWGLEIVLLVVGMNASAAWTPGPLVILGELPGSATAWERTVTQGNRSVRLSGVSFRTPDCEFQVLDNPPQARRSLAAALEAAGAVAGANGGYFHKDQKPLGLVISGGKTLHVFERAKLLSGILELRNGRTALVRAEKFQASASVQEALQAGPWLVEGGAVISGLHAGRMARRTVVAMTGRSHWMLLATSPVTLAELGEVLTLPGLSGKENIREALNLDGGSSTLLLALREGRPLLDIPSFGSVRNYLAIVPRHR